MLYVSVGGGGGSIERLLLVLLRGGVVGIDRRGRGGIIEGGCCMYW